MHRVGITFGIIIMALSIGLVGAQETELTGVLDDDTPSMAYEVNLQAGESLLVTVEATGGDLDTVLEVRNLAGDLVAYNDDRGPHITDSALIYEASERGIHFVIVGRYEFTATQGPYTLTYRTGEADAFSLIEIFPRYDLSGPEQTFDTRHFRIHFTLEGRDATTLAYVEQTGLAMEEVRRVQIERFGWPEPPADGARGGDSRYDVYLADISREDILGQVLPELPYGDNPATPFVEANAGPSYILLENDFDDSDLRGSPLEHMRSTAAHEFHHAIQVGYDSGYDPSWYYEATSVWMETATVAEDQDATEEVAYNFQYPEICFGTEVEDPFGGQLRYGYWIFIESIAAAHGHEAVRALWANIPRYGGFEALERTLRDYDDSLLEALVRYRLKNLVRDYDLAPLFEATVWLEDTIRRTGMQRFIGKGVQELGANYLELRLPDGAFEVSLRNDDGRLRLWAVGIAGKTASIIPLERRGTVDSGAYERLYLMVFNPDFDNSVNDCYYTEYDLDVQPGTDSPALVGAVWDVPHFLPLR